MHRVTVVALDGVLAFDLSTPSEVLGRVRLPSGEPGYEVRICGLTREVDAGALKLRLSYGLAELQHADTIILPGIADISQPVPPELAHAVRRASQAGVRVATICTGAFLLAAIGLLEQRKTKGVPPGNGFLKFT
jgi:transcriptional regulator GlxA family with amidase domain